MQRCAVTVECDVIAKFKLVEVGFTQDLYNRKTLGDQFYTFGVLCLVEASKFR